MIVQQYIREIKQNLNDVLKMCLHGKCGFERLLSSFRQTENKGFLYRVIKRNRAWLTL